MRYDPIATRAFITVHMKSNARVSGKDVLRYSRIVRTVRDIYSYQPFIGFIVLNLDPITVGAKYVCMTRTRYLVFSDNASFRVGQS